MTPKCLNPNTHPKYTTIKSMGFGFIIIGFAIWFAFLFLVITDPDNTIEYLGLPTLAMIIMYLGAEIEVVRLNNELLRVPGDQHSKHQN